MKISIGDMFRDTYYDNHNPKMAKRTIRVIEVTDNGVVAEVVTDVTGEAPARPRKTKLSLKTLRSGYEPANT